MARGGFSTRIDVPGLAKPRAALARLRELGADLRPFMEDARGILIRSVLRRFSTGRGPGGIPWPPSKRTISAAAPRPDFIGPHQGGLTLVDTGDLRDSIRGEVGSNYVEVGSDGLKNPVKAIANQFGSHRQAVVKRHTRKGKLSRGTTTAFGVTIQTYREVNVRAHGMITNLPARPFIGIDDEDEADVGAAWQERLIREFTAAAQGA